MARVPLQQNLTQELAAGSEVQFGATSVDPQRDVVSDDIKRQGQAMQQFGQVINKLDDELNNAESKKLYNNFYSELNSITTNYQNLKGAQAVAVTGEFDDKTPRYAVDDANNNIKTLLEKYQGQTSNNVVKYMFENMAQVSIKSAQDKITQHSIKQQRIFKEAETKSKIENHQNEAIMSSSKYADPGGAYQISFFAGLREIQEFAIDKNWNVDPSKGAVSSQYLEMVNEYTKNIHDGAIDNFNAGDNAAGAKAYLNAHLEGFGIGGEQVLTIDNETAIKNLSKVLKRENEFCAEKICNNILDAKGNSNDNRFLSQANKLLTLDSNNTVDNGNGDSVIDGNNASEMLNVENSVSENIEQLEKIKNTSKFYKLDSNQTLIPQHQTTHLFAIQKLGVEKADSLYTEAKSNIEIDQEKIKNDFAYATQINKKIMDNYMKLVIDNVEIKYSPKVQTITKEIIKLENTPDVYKKRISSNLGPFPGTKEFKKSEIDRKKRLKIKNLKEELKSAKEQSDKYINQIANDLLILKGDIDYEYNPNKQYVKVDERTKLPPLSYFEKQLKETVKDETKLEYALTDLKDKYNRARDTRLANYNMAYSQAEDIAFARPDGWKDLKLNDININQFSKDDQIKLKGGQPDVSHTDAVHDIETNDAEILTDENKLKEYRYALSPGKYQYYLNEIKNNTSNKSKGSNVKVDTDIFEEGLRLNGLGKELLYGPNINKPANKEKYDTLKMVYRDRLNWYYENGVTIDYDKKKNIVKEILMDKVIEDKFFDKEIIFEGKERTDNFEKLYVNVSKPNPNYEIGVDNEKTIDEVVYLKDIPNSVSAEIKLSLYIRGIAFTQQAIANEYFKAGRPKSGENYKKYLERKMLKGE